jgi:hypothetical protein
MCGRLRDGLSKARHGLVEGLAGFILGAKRIDDKLLEDIETQLLSADAGVKTTNAIIQHPNLPQGVGRPAWMMQKPLGIHYVLQSNDDKTVQMATPNQPMMSRLITKQAISTPSIDKFRIWLCSYDALDSSLVNAFRKRKYPCCSIRSFLLEELLIRPLHKTNRRISPSKLAR